MHASLAQLTMIVVVRKRCGIDRSLPQYGCAAYRSVAARGYPVREKLLGSGGGTGGKWQQTMKGQEHATEAGERQGGRPRPT